MGNLDNVDLRARALEEQDILIYYWYNWFDEQLFTEKINSESNISYSNFAKDVLTQNLDIIPNMSMNNLVYLLSSSEDSINKIVVEEIMRRFHLGEHIFSGENAEMDCFGVRRDLWNQVFSKLGRENVEELKTFINSSLDNLKQSNPRVYELADKIPTYIGIDSFLHFYEQGIFTPEKIELLEKMSNENPNIFKTINFGIFEEQIFEMGEEFVSRIAKFPNFSAKFIKLSRNNPELFEVIKKGFIELEQTESLQEALDIEYKTLGYVTRKAFEIKGELDFETITNCALRKEEFNTTISMDYMENYNEEFDKKCDEQYAKQKISLADKKNILLTKYFGMNNSNAQKFFMRYIKNIEQIEVTEPELINYINEIVNVLAIEDETDLDKVYYSMEKRFTPLDKIHFEYGLRESYTQTFSETLKETDEKIKNLNEVQYIEFEGKKIKQVKLNGEFNLLVHSTDSGFKGDKSVEESFRALTAPEDPSSHLASSCFINQDFLGHVPARGNGVLAGFANVDTKDLSLVGPTDINTHIRNYNYQSANGMYMSASNLPYNSRKVYNEVPIERKKPDYLLIFDDSTEDIISNTYKSAIEFDIPVIFMDKREIEKQQLQNLDLMINEFKENGDLAVLEKLISTYETNVAGWLLNRVPSETDDSLTNSINNERFREDFEQRESGIYDIIGEYIVQNQEKEDFTDKLAVMSEIMQREMDKYDLINIEKTPISKTKMKFNAERIKEKIDLLLSPQKENISNENAEIDINLATIAQDAIEHNGIGLSDLKELKTIKLKSVQKEEEQVTYE